MACRAVGYYSNDANGVDQTLIEYWDGASWAISASANPVTIQNNILNSLTCPSNSDCWAVGYHVAATTYQTLIEHWDGAAWTLVTAPNPASARTNFLNGVTCASVSDCWAVGQSSVDVGAGNPYQTLIEHWDGSSWTIVSSPNTDTTQNNALNAVTCASASQCWAVGDPTLIEKWNGTRWSIVSFPQSDATLTGVTCTSTSDCWAVGYSSATVIAHWDGSAWTVVPSPNQPSANNYLFGVTCASASECWATGYYYTGSPTQTLVEQWDGSSWTIINSPNTSATVYNQLNAIACASASNCFAVGYAYPVTSASQNLIEQWNGANDFVFFARRGELVSNHREDHEVSMLALHLLQNCMVYINTLMLQQVLAQPHWGRKLTPRDLSALTPLIWEHVNPYGRFELDMDARLPLQ